MKIRCIFLRVTPLWFVFSFITISNGVHLSGQDECVTYSYIWEGQTGYVTAAFTSAMRQLFISGMHKVSVMPLHNWDHPLWGFVFNVIKNTSLLKKRRDCMLRFVCHLRLSPPSMMGNCNPFSVSDTSSLRWLASIACHSSSSVCLLNGSRLSRRVPENNTGSCAETIRDSYKLNDPFAVSSEVKLECGHKALVGPGKK